MKSNSKTILSSTRSNSNNSSTNTARFIKTGSPSSSKTSFFPFDNPFVTSYVSKSSTTPSLSPATSSLTTIDTSPSTSSPSLSSSLSPSTSEYKRGLAIIGFITLLFSSNSPILHSAFVNSSNPPSVLLLNAMTSSIALVGLVLFGPFLDSMVPLPEVLKRNLEKSNNPITNYKGDSMKEGNESFITQITKNNQNINIPYLMAGTELGFWKTLGTTANLYGLSLTTSNHAAFLIQLTTLIVPSVQGLMGVPVPKRIWTSIGLALSGIYLFTQDVAADVGVDAMDSTLNTMLLGDVLCVVAAAFYATYDLRLFSHGKNVPPLPLIRTKIAVQAFLSCVMLSLLGDQNGLNEIGTYVHNLFSSSSSSDLLLVGSAVMWSGLIINALVPFLQVSGQQTVGASRAQVVYASQPLWASILSFALLGETLSDNGMRGGMLFLIAIFLAASAGSPDPDCERDNCEV